MNDEPLNSMNCSKAEKILWAFTPSRSHPDDLESILVQRRPLLADAVERIRESAFTGNKHHQLFVGPRGSGKSFIVTVVVNRLCIDESLKDRLRIAWLNEDETRTTFLEMLVGIYQALVNRYPDEYKAETLERAYEIGSDDALGYLSTQLTSRLGSRTIVVVAENLDALFDGLKEQGQMQLRSFLQESRQFAFLATAQRLVSDIIDRNMPFFGFFQTEHLKPLNVKEATELLGNIARLRGDVELVRLLATSRGHARVRALHHLSGGNHRIYIVLSNFITHDNLDDILLPFMKMVDDLTPYYQERIRWLPPLQRKIVEYLCTCEETVPVKDIAKKLFSSPQSISGQLQELREKGYVSSNQRGRESLYEICEPLMRICVEVKENHGQQPLRLLVNFLRAWYDDSELNQRLGITMPSSASCAYLQSAIQKNQAEGSLLKRILLRNIEQSLSDKMQASEVEDILKEMQGKAEEVLPAFNYWAEGDAEMGVECLRQAIDKEPSPSRKVVLLMELANLHLHMNRPQQAIEDCTAIIAVHGVTEEKASGIHFIRALLYGLAGDSKKAVEDYTAVVSLPGTPAEQVVRALVNRGIAYGQAGDLKREIGDYTAVVSLPGAPAEQVAEAFVNRGIVCEQAGDFKKAIEDFTAVVSLPGAPAEQVARALVNRGIVCAQAGDFKKAIEDFTGVISLPGAPAEGVARALVNRGIACGRAGDSRREIEDYTAVISLPGAPAEGVARALVNRGIASGLAGDFKKAIEDYAAVISLPSVPAEQVAQALVNRGITYGQVGDSQHEMEDYTAVISLPGAPAEHVVDANLCLSELHFGKGRWREGFAVIEAGFRCGAKAKPCYFGDATGIISALFVAGLNPAGRNEKVRNLFGLYKKFKALPPLCDAVIKHIGGVFRAGAPFPSSDNLDGWLSAWQEATDGSEDAKLFLRLLRIGIDFLKSGGKDVGILLSLTSPERRILEQAFEIAEE